MLRFLIYSLILFLLIRALSKFWRGLQNGLQGGAASAGAAGTRVPQRGVQMARDPICGTFVVPENAVTASRGRETLYFCSTTCRDRYAAESTARARRSVETSGRTA